LSLLADGIAVADDSTLIVTGDSVYGVRPGGTVRWSRAPGAASAVVGTGGIGYYYYRIGAIGTLAAFQTTDGSEAWSVSVDSAPTGFGVGPVLTADGAVIFAAGRRFIALDAATGVERWRHQVAGNPMASPLLTDSGLLIVVDATGYVEGLAVGAAPANAPWPMAWGGNRRRGRTNTP
jgi:outer membrane protein assembly factor BamB